MYRPGVASWNATDFEDYTVIIYEMRDGRHLSARYDRQPGDMWLVSSEDLSVIAGPYSTKHAAFTETLTAAKGA